MSIQESDLQGTEGSNPELKEKTQKLLLISEENQDLHRILELSSEKLGRAEGMETVAQ